jgi:CheY-like chemotaxis protein
VSDYVLIVDDDEDARRILGVIVKSLDISFESAPNGLMALERIKQKRPMLILLDLMMPEMDGFAMLSNLQCDPNMRHIPVIVVTACTRDQIDMLQLPGVKNVVPKGDLLDLRGLIVNLLGKSSPSPAPR